MPNKLRVPYKLTKVLLKRERFILDLDQSVGGQVLSWTQYVENTSISKDAELKLILLNSLDIFASGDEQKLKAWNILMSKLPFSGQINDKWGFYGRIYFNEFKTVPEETNFHGEVNVGFNIDNFIGRYITKTKLFNDIFQYDVPAALENVASVNLHNLMYNLPKNQNGYTLFVVPILTEKNIARELYSERGIRCLVDLMTGNENPYNTAARIDYYERLSSHWLLTNPNFQERMRMRIACELCMLNAMQTPHFMLRAEGITLLTKIENLKTKITDARIDAEFKVLCSIYDFSNTDHCHNALDLVSAQIDKPIEAVAIPELH